MDIDKINELIKEYEDNDGISNQSNKINEVIENLGGNFRCKGGSIRVDTMAIYIPLLVARAILDTEGEGD